MALRANTNFYLYTGLDATASDGAEAYTFLKEANVVQFTHLHYGNPEQIPEVLTSVQTWFADDETINTLAFPFVTYTEAYDYNDEPPRIARIVRGLQTIKDTNWTAIVGNPE